jgi:hypothetical protein
MFHGPKTIKASAVVEFWLFFFYFITFTHSFLFISIILMALQLTSAIKWGLLAGLVSLIMRSNKRSPFGSLCQDPSPVYTPEYYPNGTFLQLPTGTMRYWLFGDPEGERVVLVHGFSVPCAIYTKLAQELVKI